MVNHYEVHVIFQDNEHQLQENILHHFIPFINSIYSNDLFISSDASICSTMVFSPLGNSGHVVVSVFIDFLINSKRDAPFHSLWLFSCRLVWPS